MNNYIAFPSLGIELNVSNIAFTIGKLDVYWYGIIIGTALIVGYILAYLNAKKASIDPEHITNIVLICAPVSIVFARLYYVIFSLDYYVENPAKIFALRDGGIAIYGAVIGAIISCLIYCKAKKLNTLKIFDLCIPSVILGQAIGRWGNFFNKEAFGEQTTSFLRMTLYKKGQFIDVHPTFLYESLWNFLVFSLLLIFSKKKKYDGEIFLIYITLYGLGRFFIEGLRTDSLYIGDFRVSQIIAGVSFLVGLILLIVNRLKSRHA